MGVVRGGRQVRRKDDLAWLREAAAGGGPLVRSQPLGAGCRRGGEVGQPCKRHSPVCQGESVIPRGDGDAPLGEEKGEGGSIKGAGLSSAETLSPLPPLPL